MPTHPLAVKPAFVPYATSLVGIPNHRLLSVRLYIEDERKGHERRVSAEFALHLPRCEVGAADQLKPADTTWRFLVGLLVVAHMVLEDRYNIILAGDDGVVGKSEERIRVSRSSVRRYRVDEYTVNPDRRRKGYRRNVQGA